MAQVMTVGERWRLTVEGRTAQGTPGRIEGIPVWTVAPPLITLQPSADGLKCLATPTGPGDCIIQVVAGALLFDYAVSVLSSSAVTLVIAAEKAPTP